MNDEELIKSINAIINNNLPGWIISDQEDCWHLVDDQDVCVFKGTLSEIHQKVQSI
jgi:hypothetical protein